MKKIITFLLCLIAPLLFGASSIYYPPGTGSTGGASPIAYTNILWVSAASNTAAILGRQDKPWGSISGALSVATSGQMIKIAPGEVHSLETGQIRLPDNVGLDYSGAVLLSGGNHLQDGIFIVPGDNSLIFGYGGTIGCTNDWLDNFCPGWGAIGAIDPTDGVFTNVYVLGGLITNASSDIFYVAQSIPNTNTYSMYVRDVVSLYEKGAAHWDIIALGGDDKSTFHFENCVLEIQGSPDQFESFSGGATALLRWTGDGKLRLNNCRLWSTNSYYATSYIVGPRAGKPPIEITGGDYRVYTLDALSNWYADNGSLTYTNRVQWPPSNSEGYCSINGAFMSFGSNTFGTYPATAADRLVFWDDSANGTRYATIGSGLTMSGTDLSVSAKGYMLTFIGSGAGAPADSTVYYVGGDIAAAANGWLNTTYANASIVVPASGTITRFYVKVRIRTANGTTEDVVHTIRINDSTDVGSLSLDYDQAERSGSVTGLSTAVVAGNTITLKITCPAWATNPTGVSLYGYVWIE